MHLFHLFEAPLGSFGVVGDLDDGKSFRPDDRRIITSPKTLPKLSNAFRHVPEVIDVCFLPLKFQVRDPNDLAERIAGVWPRDVAEKRLFRELPAPSAPGAITVVLTHNEGTNRVPLTPWIIAHRMGHAIAYSMRKEINGLFNTLDDVFRFLKAKMNLKPEEVAYAIGKMRSTRQRRLTSYFEFVFECFAQYLIAGRIKFNRFTDPVSIEASDGLHTQDDFADHLNEVLDFTEDKLNAKCAEILASLKGKVVVL